MSEINQHDKQEPLRRGPSAKELGGMLFVAVGGATLLGYGLPPLAEHVLNSHKADNVEQVEDPHSHTIDVSILDEDPQRVIVAVRHDIDSIHS